MSSREIDPALLAAYRETLFDVSGPDPFTLRVGAPSTELQALHEQHRVTSSAFVTACNPRSERLADKENNERHARLCAELRSAGCASYEGQGKHPSNSWPPERSLLVLGLDLPTARELATRWGQNAIVWSGPDAVPQLIVTADNDEARR